MNDRHGEMSCEEFQAQLPELIGSGKIDANHPHLKNCELCKALPKLWDKIEMALKNEEGFMVRKEEVTAQKEDPKVGPETPTI